MTSGRQMTTKEFVRRARQMYEGRYDYSKTDYKKSMLKVIITCPEHGDFTITPNAHLNGQGCQTCGRIKSRLFRLPTTEQFIAKASLKYGDLDDYSKVDYKGQGIPVTIICRIHGEYTLKPKSYMKGSRCRKCANQAKRVGTERFIERARLIHGDKYDYSRVQYTRSQERVIIICPLHGPFSQTANSHLQGCGCWDCRNDLRRSNLQEFVEKARAIHGDKYDYSKAEYINNQSPLTIICPIHQEFTQTPNGHLSGSTGCPGCSQSRGEAQVAGFLDKLGIRYQREKRFDGCRNIHPLAFDFYVCIGKTYILIEFDGEQHTRPVDYFGGVSGFKERQKNDQIKNEFAIKQNVPLIRVSYTVKNIEAHLRFRLEDCLGYSLDTLPPLPPPFISREVPEFDPNGCYQLGFALSQENKEPVKQVVKQQYAPQVRLSYRQVEELQALQEATGLSIQQLIDKGIELVVGLYQKDKMMV